MSEGAATGRAVRRKKKFDIFEKALPEVQKKKTASKMRSKTLDGKVDKPEVVSSNAHSKSNNPIKSCEEIETESETGFQTETVDLRKIQAFHLEMRRKLLHSVFVTTYKACFVPPILSRTSWCLQ